MEPKYLTKTNVQLNSDILRTKKDKKILRKAPEEWMFAGCSDVLCLQQIFKEKLEFTSEFWLFSLFLKV